MEFVLLLHPQGHREEKEHSGAKISWMILDLPVFQGSLDTHLENVFDVSFLQQFPEAEMTDHYDSNSFLLAEPSYTNTI